MREKNPIKEVIVKFLSQGLSQFEERAGYCDNILSKVHRDIAFILIYQIFNRLTITLSFS